jgi:HEAT repeats
MDQSNYDVSILKSYKRSAAKVYGKHRITTNASEQSQVIGKLPKLSVSGDWGRYTEQMQNDVPNVEADPVGYCIWGLKYGNPIERSNAADMLRSCGNDLETAIPILVELLRQDEIANVRAQCAFALMEISYSLQEKTQIAVAPLLEALQQDEDAEVRSLAAGALGAIGSVTKEVVPALEKALQDEHEWVREAAQEALNQISD